MVLIKFIFLFIAILTFDSFELSAKVNPNSVMLDEYLKIHNDFVNLHCNAKVVKTYSDLDQKYRGDGNFIPVTIEGKVDQKVIKVLLPLITEKTTWIQSQIDHLKKLKSFEIILQNIKRLENDVSLLQEAKKDFFFAKNKKQKDKIETRAKRQFVQMLIELQLLKDSATFLMSFKFPLDHLALRAEYDRTKAVNTRESRTKANNIYLFRKIVQDGTFDVKRTRNDAVIRAAFDTLFNSLNDEKENVRIFLTENERSDFKYIIKNFRILLNNGKKVFSIRLTEWLSRTQRSYVFYQELEAGKKNKSGESELEVTSILAAKAHALSNLREFVLSKEAEVYQYWSKQPEIYQSLYAIETILYAEVGRIDAPDALERKDVAQIVINRHQNPIYNQLGVKDSLIPYLPKELNTEQYKWLNVLFKEGEFSFTYFYIPGNFHLYCPDVSKMGKFLRRQNVRIAQDYFKFPRDSFNALRYFSRMSMYGRIEMDSLWDNYEALPEVPGKPVKNLKKLSRLFKQDRYNYLYHFNSGASEKTYLVVEMKGKNYVVDAQNPNKLFYYRNPHHFRYFAPVLK